MAVRNSSLSFETTNRNLWAPGEGIDLSIDTGDLFIVDDEVSIPFGFGSLSGEIFADFRLGLVAYADLGRSGYFDSTYQFDVNVDYSSALALDSTVPNGDKIRFDFSDWSVKADLDSVGVEGNAVAGVKFIAELDAGVRNLDYDFFLTSGENESITFVSIDEEYTIIEIGTEDFGLPLEFEIGEPDGNYFRVGLPSGADTSGTSRSLKVTSTGEGDPFIEARGDIDEAITELLGAIPPLAPVGKVLERSVFLEIEYKLDEISDLIPSGAFDLNASLVDIEAYFETYVTEDLELEVKNSTKPVNIILHSDNATPNNYADDKVVSTHVGASNVTIDAPTSAVLAGLGNNGNFGTATVTAYYDLAPVEYTHTVGVGVESALTISVLKASLSGYLVPDALEFDRGPLFEVVLPGKELGELLGINTTEDGAFKDELFELPSHGYTLDSGKFTNASAGLNPTSWNYNAGDYNQVTERFEVFVTETAPSGWDPEAANAVQAVVEYNRALFENEAQALINFEDIYNPTGIADWENQPGNSFETLGPGLTQISGQSNTVRLWQGNTDSQVQIPSPSSNSHVLLQALDQNGSATDPGLKVGIIKNDGSPSFFDPVYIGGPFGVNDAISVKDRMALEYDGFFSGTLAVVYEYDGFQLRSVSPVNVIGGSGDDLMLVHSDGSGMLFDGKGGNDELIANFGLTHAGIPIEFSTATDKNYLDGITIAGNISVKNIEGFILHTGDTNDRLSSGSSNDRFETGGGEDFIEIFADQNDESFSSGDDDDVILRFHDASVSGSDDDFIVGGKGHDNLIIDARDTGGSTDGSTLQYIDPSASSNVSAIGRAGSYAEILVDIYQKVEVHQVFSGFDSGVGIKYGQGNAASLVNGSVEYVSYLGSDTTRDIALFNLGYEYDGGEGGVVGTSGAIFAHRDTLIGDFNVQAENISLRETGTSLSFGYPEYGVRLIAEDRLDHTGPEITLEFGGSTIKGFERFVAKGTRNDDFFLGGKWSDAFNGYSGDDFIDGGEFDPFLHTTSLAAGFEFTISAEQDILYGGGGADTFRWSDDGADIIDGDAQRGFNGVVIEDFDANDTLIVEAEAGSLGLQYGLFDSLSGPVDPTGSNRIVFDATSSQADLLNALAYINFGTERDGTKFGFGLRFGDTLNVPGSFDPATGIPYADTTDEWLNYRNVEHVNITADFRTYNPDGSVTINEDIHDDLLIYQGGASYIAGEKADGTDADVFAADFTGQTASLNFIIIEDDTTGYRMNNGVFVQGFERAIIKGGSGDDKLIGGQLSDYLEGGDGIDLLYGGDDFASDPQVGFDRLIGGAGDDIVVWYSDGNDFADGGDGSDTLIVGNEGLGLTVTASLEDFSLAFDALGADADLVTFEAALADLDSLGVTLYDAVAAFDGLTRSLEFQNFEKINVLGSNEHNDVVFGQNGQILYGGDTVGDADVLFADFSASSEGRNLTINADGSDDATPTTAIGSFDANGGFVGDSVAFQDIGNGTSIAGFERLIVKGGFGNDTITGGALADVIRGGIGRDFLDAGTGGTLAERDKVYGGEDDDVITYSGDHVFADAGWDGPGIEADRLEIALDPTTYTSGLELVVLDDAGAQMDSFVAGTAASTTRATLTSFFALRTAFAGDPNSSAQADALRYDFDANNSLIYRNVDAIRLEGSDQADFLASATRETELIGGDGDDILALTSGRVNAVGGAGLDVYAIDSVVGTISGEDVEGGILYYQNHALADLNFSVENDENLVITAPDGRITIIGYFAAGGEGLNFTFETVDYTGKLILGTLPGITPGGVAVAGNSIVGTSGDDEILATSLTADADTVRAGAGDDIIEATAGEDFYDGGAGVDTLSYQETATAGVTLRLDLGFGESGNAANDIYASIENINGTDFDDDVRGNSADNALIGNDGDDFLEGLDGEDIISGGNGNDTLRGDDDISATGESGSDDRLSGDAGNDTLFGGLGADLLVGGDGDDILDGGSGHDALYGGRGDDTAVGDGPASNSDLGIDVYFHGGDDDETTVGVDENGYDTFDGNDGFDTVDLSDYEFGVSVGVSATSEILTDYTDRATITSANAVGQFTNVEQYILTDFGDYVRDSAAFREYRGGAGDDFFVSEIDNSLATAFRSVYDGGVGVDTLRFGLVGSQGIVADFSGSTKTVEDTFGIRQTVISIERLFGTDVSDSFIGDEKQNTFFDFEGIDFFDGKGGNDYVHAGVSMASFNDTYIGGEGFDTLDYSSSETGIIVDAAASATDATSTPFGIGTDTISGFERIIGGIGNDQITGENVNNILDGGSGIGDDELHGLGGNDVLIGGGGADLLYGSDAASNPDDEIDIVDFGSEIIDGGTQGVNVDLSVQFGSGGSEAIDSFGNTDTLFNIDGARGTSLNDSLKGSAGYNLFAGGDGDDVIEGLGDADELMGQGGEDVFILNGGDVFGEEYIDGGTGTDTLHLRSTGVENFDFTAGDLLSIEEVIFNEDGGASEQTLTISANEYNSSEGGMALSSNTFAIIAETLNVDFQSDEVAVDLSGLTTTGWGAEDSINVTAGAGSQLVYGSDEVETISTGAGADVVNAGGGDDIIDGGMGNDVLLGGDGDDTIVGGVGLGMLNLNAGATTDQYAEATDFGLPSDALTVEMLLRSTGPLDSSMLNHFMSYGVSGSTNELLLGGRTTGTADLFFAINGSIIDTGVSTALLYDMQEHRVSLAINTFTEEVTLYIDGSEVFNTVVAGMSPLKSSGTLIFGQEQDTLGGGFQANQIYRGEIGDLRVWDDVRTAQEIADIAFVEIADPSADASLIANWRPDASNPASIEDVAGDADLTLKTISGTGSLPTFSNLDDNGNDVLEGGVGADALDGGAGQDAAQYAGAASGLLADLQFAQFNTGDAAGDAYVSIEDLNGSGFADDLRGNGGDNVIDGVVGNDVINGRGGNDTLIGDVGNDVLLGGAGADALDGGAGIDLADYVDAGSGLVVDLQFTANNTGDALGDTYTAIENVRGSVNDDSLRGDAGNNVVSGLGGNDFIVGRNGDDTLNGNGGDDTLRGGAGADSLNGGDGIDVVDYSDIATGLVLDLQFIANNTGDAAGDSYTNVENLTGTNADDNLRGNAGDNVITARGGNDFMSGRDGDDHLIGSAGNDTLRGGNGADRLVGGGGIDVADYRDIGAGLLADLQFTVNNTGGALGDTYVTIENLFGTGSDDSLRGNGLDNLILGGNGNDFLVGRSGVDTLVGNAGNDILRGGTGGDILNGGNGQDRADYSDATFNVRVDLVNSAVNVGAHALGDTYISIEDIRGSSGFKDDLRGDAGANVLQGLGGDDILTGRAGNDTLQGSVGDDVLNGGAGNDLLIGGSGADTFVYTTPTQGVDSIINFAINSDVIHLDDAGFTSLSAGALSAANFRNGSAAVDANDFLVYDGTTLFYDADGNGAGAQVALGTFNNGAALDQNDFLIV